MNFQTLINLFAQYPITTAVITVFVGGGMIYWAWKKRKEAQKNFIVDAHGYKLKEGNNV